MPDSAHSALPVVAVFTGDPAGIGPELVETLLAGEVWRARARLILIGQRAALSAPADVLWHDWPGLRDAAYPPGIADAANGRYMLEGLAQGVDLLQQGRADALCFAPLNKSALRQGGMTQEDELRWFAERMGFQGVCGELNVLQSLWTARVTSHVPLKSVSSLLSAEKVAEAIGMVSRALRASGVTQPRIGVCGLNPHNGDHGNYGDEEQRIIEPGIRLAAAQGHAAQGPFPADTAFVRAIRAEGGYDAVVTMYHDQGQIAMKLMGFEQGVTVHGGLPWPITTPAHGTAYDIVGQRKANAQALINAFELAVRMAHSRRPAPAPLLTKETSP
ncbi:MAG: 4-hydroxythreonine-4-phosphate dehydrogenase PdxA [Limnohabitans sp.]